MFCVCEHFPDSPHTQCLLTSSPHSRTLPRPGTDLLQRPTVPQLCSSSSSGGGVETSRCFPPPSPSTAPSSHRSLRGQHITKHGFCRSRFGGAPGGSGRRLLRAVGRSSRGSGRVRFRPQSEVRTSVRTRRDLHPKQHMLLLQRLRGGDLPVW